MRSSRPATADARGCRTPTATVFWGCLAALGLAACNDNNAYVPPPPPKVTIAQPLSQPTTRYLEFTGNTAFDQRRRSRGARPGFARRDQIQGRSLVKKGTLLFVIQRNVYEAQLEQAQGDARLGPGHRSSTPRREYDRQSTLGKVRFRLAGPCRGRQGQSRLRRRPTSPTPRPISRSPDQSRLHRGAARPSTASSRAISSMSARWSAIRARPSLPPSSRSIRSTSTSTSSETAVLRIKEALGQAGQDDARRRKRFPSRSGCRARTAIRTRGTSTTSRPQVDAVDRHAAGPGGVRQQGPRAAARPLRPRARAGQNVDNSLLVADNAIGTNQHGSICWCSARTTWSSSAR